MIFSKKIISSIFRIFFSVTIVITVIIASYHFWNPGKAITNGKYDLKQNGIWLQHGWLGADSWFIRYNKNPNKFKNTKSINKLKFLLEKYHFTDLYPHLCPCKNNGEIADVDQGQVRQFLEIMKGFKVMPWVGGVLDVNVFPQSKQWRKKFISSVTQLLIDYPSLYGIHINFEPMPSGNTDFLTLLKELKDNLPKNKIISVAAYPPPTICQPVKDVHWDKTYYKNVCQYADQLVVMMYDTGIQFQKIYQNLMSLWTVEVIEWSENIDILFGLPAYEDKGVDYHYPDVENLQNSLSGMYSGLEKINKNILKNYKGISIYSEWEMDNHEWKYLSDNFKKIE